MHKALATLVITALALSGCASSSQQPAATEREPKLQTEQQVADYLREQVQRLQPLELEANSSWFAASVEGTDEAFARSKSADDALNSFLANPRLFSEIEAARKAGFVRDPVLARQLEVLYRAMLGKQVPPEMLARITDLEKQVEQAFNTYRGELNGREVTNNEVMEVLRTSRDSSELEAAWKAQKAVGPLVAPKLAELVQLRNEVARSLGFRDYYALRLAELELREDELLALFDELDRLTAKPFFALKRKVDQRLAERLGIETHELSPWHYQNPFFQEPPSVFETGLAKTYEKVDTLALCRTFYEGIGLQVEPIIERSDLYEREGKTPHAFAAHIDRKEDIRIIANIVAGIDWQQTMVHELGHAVYDAYLNPDLPWLLRKASHPLTTEGVAMMFDHLVPKPQWAAKLDVVSEEQAEQVASEAQAQQAFALLLFSRWTQVMLRFERAMYADPTQDLNALWWSLVERYQGLDKPPGRDAPDYASKIHLVIVPVYYQNYMLGELFAAQVHERLAEIEGKPFDEAVLVGNPTIGEFLKTELFAPGALYSWNELTERVTGQELSADAFARRF